MTTTIFTTTFDGQAAVSQYTIRDLLTITGNSQGKVRVTFAAGASGIFTVDNASIGISSGVNGDTTTTPVPLTFNGSSGFSISFGSTITSDWASLSGFTSSNNLVVIYDSTVAGQGSAASHNSLPVVNCTIYYNPGTTGYNQATTPPGFVRVFGQNFGTLTVETDPIAGYDQTPDPPPQRGWVQKLKAASLVAALAVPQLVPALFPGPSDPAKTLGWAREFVHPTDNFKANRDYAYRVSQSAGQLTNDPIVRGTGDWVSSDLKSTVTYKQWIVYQDYVRPPYVPSLANKTNEWQSELVYPGDNFRRKRDANYSVAQQAGFIDFNREFIPSTFKVDQVRSQVPYKKWFIYDDQFEPVRVPIETENKDWFRPFSEPQRKPRPVVFQQSFVDPVPEVTVLTKWFHPLDEPQRQKIGLRPHLQQSTAYVEAGPFAEQTNVNWLAPFSEPRRFRQAIPAPDQPYLAFEVEPPVLEQVEWFKPLSEPVRPPRALVAGAQQSFAFVQVGVVAETVSVAHWHKPFSERYPIRRRVAQNQELIEAPSGEIERLDATKWLPPQATVVAKRQYQYQSLTAPLPVVVVAQPVPLPDKWLNPLSEPVRRLRRAAWFQAYSFVNFGPFPEVVRVTNWFEPLSEPQRHPLRLQTNVQQAILQQQMAPIVSFSSLYTDVTFTSVTQYPAKSFFVQPGGEAEEVDIGKWLLPLSEPTRLRMLPVSEQQAFTVPALAQELVGVDLRHWLTPLSEPNRWHGLLPASQEYSVLPQLEVTLIPPESARYLIPLSEPVRYRLSVPAYQQQSLIYLDQFGLYGVGTTAGSSAVIGIGRLSGLMLGEGKSGLVQLKGGKSKTGITGGQGLIKISGGKGKPKVKRDP